MTEGGLQSVEGSHPALRDEGFKDKMLERAERVFTECSDKYITGLRKVPKW